MDHINRHTFLKQTVGIGALAVWNPFSPALLARAAGYAPEKDAIFSRLVQANDSRVGTLLTTLGGGISTLRRSLGFDFAALAASYCCPASRYHRQAALPPAMVRIVQYLQTAQGPDGTLDLGNLGSPPDTAFILEPLCAGTSLLLPQKNKALNQVKQEIKKFIVRAGEGLTAGGVHTPNHRWVVSAALARIHALYPNPKYISRIDDWLGEGVFIDADGHYPERSSNYAEVEDRCFITLARLLNRPALLEPARRNLEMTWYYLEPNGELVTNDSRRQDQFSGKSVLDFYHHYRYLAIRDQNGQFAAITQFIEQVKGFEEEILPNSLFYFLEEPLLQKPLPALSPPPVSFDKLFGTTHLARIRRGDTTTTIFGGVDWPLIIASGRSTSANFFSFRKGEAILKYLRLSPGFFSTGYFRSEGLRKDGNSYVLYKKLEVPYYQPLPAELRNPPGDYKLSPSIDGRFWNKMDFSNRPVSNVKTLETTVTVTESDGRNELAFRVGGAENVPVTIELCFQEGGTLTGVTPVNDAQGNSFLEKGMGQYQFGRDTIAFGPGILAHKRIRGLEGEMYSSHFGTLRTEGMYVYLTGITPFEHKITLG
jgi:hypothetical protein